MIITTWNCNRGKREIKLPELDRLQSDILVIQEVSHPGKISNRELWIGDNDKQGLSVSALDNSKLKIAKCYDSNLKFALPVEVQGDIEFQILAVWIHQDKTYVSNLLRILDYYEDFILKMPTVVCGDFNANPVFDAINSKNDKLQRILEKMDKLELIGAYHTFMNEDFGSESIPTIY